MNNNTLDHIHKAWHYISFIVDLIENLSMYLSSGILLLLVLSVFFDVTLRWLFNITLPWAVEINEIGIVYITFLSSAWIMHVDGHVNIDTFLDMIQKKLGKIITIITLILSIGSLIILVLFSFKIVINNYQRGLFIQNILRIPRWLALAPIPFGLALFAIECFRKLIKLF